MAKSFGTFEAPCLILSRSWPPRGHRVVSPRGAWCSRSSVVFPTCKVTDVGRTACLGGRLTIKGSRGYAGRRHVQPVAAVCRVRKTAVRWLDHQGHGARQRRGVPEPPEDTKTAGRGPWTRLKDRADSFPVGTPAHGLFSEGVYLNPPGDTPQPRGPAPTSHKLVCPRAL